MFTSNLPPLVNQELMKFHTSRRFLLQAPPITAATPPTTTTLLDPTEAYNGSHGFDANVVMVLSVLLCALICSLGINSIIKCALRCSSLVLTAQSNNTNNPTSSQLPPNKGIKKKALKTFAIMNYSPDELINLPGRDTMCVICLSEFARGDRVRLLPKCNHGFHVRCIDKWLDSHSSCPTCRHSLIETCQKIVGCDQPGSSRLTLQPQPQPQPQPGPQETMINISPLERENLIRSYRVTAGITC